MVSDQEIAEAIDSIFRDTNPNSFTSLNDVVLRLQSNLGFDLSDKINFIRNHITLLFTAQHPSPPPPASTPASAGLGVNSNPNPNLNVPQHPNAVQHRGVAQQQQHPASIGHARAHIQPQQHPASVGNARAHIQQQQQQQQQHPASVGQALAHTQQQQQQHPASVAHARTHIQQQHIMFQGQTHFPRGPTEISFAQPGGAVVSESLSSAAAAKDGQKPKRRGGPGGLNKLCGVSPQLQTIVGQPAMPRTEIVKQLWAYIRKNNLQDPSNKRKIICNEELRLVFEVDCTDMFQMNKLLAKHILPLDSTKDSGQQSKKLKVEESKVPSTEPASVVISKVPSSEPTPIVISESLARFFGTSEKEMLQSEVYKRIDEYIKTEGLESPVNSTVVCDTKLQELLGCESTTTPEIREALARNHLFQQA